MNEGINGITVAEAEELMNLNDAGEIYRMIFRAGQVRERFRGRNVSTCAIINAKSGNCGENCAFCPQSIHSGSTIDKYPLKNAEEIYQAAMRVAGEAAAFGIVSSGRRIADAREQRTILEAVRRIADSGKISVCASLGTADRDFLRELKRAGLSRYHHNLEAAASFYPTICTTRTFADNVATAESAREAGLEVCCGCLFGLGESNEQRVELLESLRGMKITSVPLNFFNPIPGTRLEHTGRPPGALECLKIIAVARLMMPRAQLRICGGREKNLRDMQSWIFAAGADGLMIGSYLTTGGRDIGTDMRMIRDAGMTLSED